MRRRAPIATFFAILQLGATQPEVVLPIADRPQAKESPPSGWCGETAIQEALLHDGAWVSQRAIHDAGKSTHPDLYSPDVPVALASLGVSFDTYGATKGSTSGGFATFVRSAIDAGDPVIAGVKLLPTAHPDWGLDHFVLAVGYGPKGLLVNTTWDEQQWVPDGAKKGISFERAFYALRIRGVAAPKGHVSTPARATVASEDDAVVRLVVSCPAMAATGKASATLERRETPTSAAALETWPLTAKSPSRSVTLPRSKAAWFRCAAAP